MFYKEPPEGFKPDIEAVGCFLENQGKFLTLKRAGGKREEGKWGLPGGKISPGESLKEALQREILEETGITIQSKELEYIAPAYIKYEDYSAVYHMFSSKLLDPHIPITINLNEHTDFDWLSLEEILEAPERMEYMDDCVRLAYGL